VFKKIFKTDKWHPYVKVISKILSPKFLLDCIIPNDVFKSLKAITIKENEEDAFRQIIAYSLFNAVFIGLPGTVGWGVYVSMAIEFVMAFQIAKMTGIIQTVSLFPIKDALKKLASMLASIGIASVTVVYGVKKLLDIMFNLFAQFVITGFATTLSVFVTTLFYGLFLYLAFSEIKQLQKEKLSAVAVLRISKNAANYSYKIGKSLVKLVFKDFPKLLKQIKSNITDAFNIQKDTQKVIRGDLFHITCLGYLLEGKEEYLQGPFSNLWLNSVKLTFPNQLGEDATFEQIQDHLNTYSSDQFPKVIQNIKSKFFEVLETEYENNDNDQISTELIKEQNNPGYDAKFINEETGQVALINYKFTSDINYIETHLAKYPDIPAKVPSDVYEKLKEHPLVINGDIESSHYSSGTINEVNKENFENILNANEELLSSSAAVAGGANLSLKLLPFIYAYSKSRISKEQLTQAISKYFPEATSKTINRIAMLTILGPVYGFFIVANLGLKTSTLNFDEKISDIVEEKPSTKEEPKAEPEDKNVNQKKFKDKKFTRRQFITLSFLEN